ncbi:MAG: serine/threonine-protein kinase [Proteobacteria bacterium]|nr:serine/threonine-protein kinase [Pseudomonadota bacterium]
MAEEKKTQLGTLDPNARLTGSTAAITPAAITPAPISSPPISSPPVDSRPPSQHMTSYLPPAPPQEDPLVGGMGAVYLATHNLLEKQVALKVLHSEFARKNDLVERFIQEAKAASRIRHENVIDISDFGSTPEGVVFFAMELLKGHDLHDVIARARLAGELLPWPRSKRIFLQICAALTAAHDKGIVHRDLKPENIYLVDFLGEPDFVKLLDFGIAKLTEVADGERKLTRTGMLFGTPEYMSPEQARGENVDLRVDVYAMGCILFQLITGRVPFEAENFMGVLSLHLTEQPPQIAVDTLDRIGAPRGLIEIVDRALAKDRNQRWQTIAELANAIRVVCGDPLPTVGGTAVMASVQAPATTTTRPGTGQVTAIAHGTAASTQHRIKTQWTGNLAVPDEAEGGAKRASKLPLLIGAVVVLGGVGVAFMMMNRGGDAKPERPGSGSAIAAIVVDAAVAPPPTPDAAPVPEVTLPDVVEIHLDSTPQGADVFDVANNSIAGKTPLGFKIPGSLATRRFTLKKKGYSDLIIELVPNRPKLDYTEALTKGAAGTTVVKTIPPLPTVGAGSGKPDVGSGAVTVPDAGSATVKPDPGVGSAVKPPDVGSAKPPEPDCPPDEFPCLKKMPNDMPKQ